MSAGNSIARSGPQADQQAEPVGFEMPAELVSRYELRVIDGTNGEQRLGLFRSTDRENPSIEITNDRTVARSDDPETVAALVKIAEASGWERITVDGSSEFRKAMWEAATREGLTVNGYEPGFAEQARVAEARRQAAERCTPETREQTPRACQPARDLDCGSTSNTDPAMVSVGVG